MKQNQTTENTKKNATDKDSIGVKSTVCEKEPLFLKKVFYILAAVAFVVVPLLSLNSGMSGDEKSSYVHSSRVYDYFANGDTAAVNTQGDPLTQNLEYYGQSFDNVTYLFIKWFHIDNPYEFRHCCNALLGWCIAFIIALLLAKTCGYRAAIMGFLLLLLSPRFLGHSFNNPKDIPFALGYTFAIYQMILLVRELPKTSWKRLLFVALGIAIANSVRIGGLILVAYLFLFCGVWYFFVNKEHKWNQGIFWTKGFVLIGKLLLTSIVGYFVSIVLWPYLQQSPIAHAKEALDLMEHYSVNLRQVFEGVNIWSTNAPWYYLPKYIFMTIPEVVILGLLAFLVFLPQIIKKQTGMITFIVFFSFFFPIFYIIYKASNVYGGWRHVLFTYPFLVTASVFGWNAWADKMKGAWKWVVYGIFALLLILPLVHICKYHPHEYVYYNQLCGGVSKNYGYYEMDYYQHSTRAASTWLDNYLIENNLKGNTPEKIKISSNDHKAIEYYFRNDTAKYYEIGYIRYYERGNSDWDYAISINTYINAYQLQHNIWPPKGTIHTIDVDGKPIAAIIKRENKADYEGYLLKSKLSDDSLPMEERINIVYAAIGKYREALAYDPNNEAALSSLVELYSGTTHIDSIVYYTDRLVEVCPNENFISYATNIYTHIYQATNNNVYLNKVFELSEKMIGINPFSAQNYYNLALMYARIGNPNRGNVIMEDCIKKMGRRFESQYYQAIYWAQTGKANDALDLLQKMTTKYPAHADECQAVINQIQGINR